VRYLESFVRFWIDFIIGDAWEVAAGIALTLVVLAGVVDRFGANPLLGFVLLGSVLAFTWIALRRATAGPR
jgi:hypothetical protein